MGKYSYPTDVTISRIRVDFFFAESADEIAFELRRLADKLDGLSDTQLDAFIAALQPEPLDR